MFVANDPAFVSQTFVQLCRHRLSSAFCVSIEAGLANSHILMYRICSSGHLVKNLSPESSAIEAKSPFFRE